MSVNMESDIMLLCIDMQPIFVRVVSQPKNILRRCAFSIAAAHGLGLTIAFTEQLPQKLGVTAPHLRDLAPAASVYAKDTFSAWLHPALSEFLSTSNVGHLLICGIETPVCVYQTCLDALGSGLQVTVLSDAVDARRSDDGQMCLQALVRAGAHILPAETVFYALLQSVHHPFFKAYTQLVKTHG